MDCWLLVMYPYPDCFRLPRLGCNTVGYCYWLYVAGFGLYAFASCRPPLLWLSHTGFLPRRLGSTVT